MCIRPCQWTRYCGNAACQKLSNPSPVEIHKIITESFSADGKTKTSRHRQNMCQCRRPCTLLKHQVRYKINTIPSLRPHSATHMRHRTNSAAFSGYFKEKRASIQRELNLRLELYDSAVCIQAVFRGHRARRLFSVRQQSTYQQKKSGERPF